MLVALEGENAWPRQRDFYVLLVCATPKKVSEGVWGMSPSAASRCKLYERTASR